MVQAKLTVHLNAKVGGAFAEDPGPCAPPQIVKLVIAWLNQISGIADELERTMGRNLRSTRMIVLLIRRVLGFFCLGLWALGAILPIIPGWPALIVAVVLLGRRDRTLRFMHLIGRRALRWLRRHPAPRISSTGRWLSEQYVVARRTLTPAIIRAERTFQF